MDKMEDPKHDSTPLQGLGLILIAAIVGGVFWFQNPLTSSRPTAPDSFHTLPGFSEDVQARLWEDPLQAVIQHRQLEFQTTEEESGHHNHSVKALAEKIRDAHNPKVRIILAMVDGSPYVEGTESRLRTRYATLAGMNVAGYAPQDAEHLGYVEMESQDKNRPGYLMPFEWVMPDSLKPHALSDPVLVLWLNDRHLQNQPLLEIGHLIHRITISVEQATAPPYQTTALTFRLIGPTDSNTLISMADDIRNTPWKDHPDLQQALSHLTIYSPWATYADAFFSSPTEEPSRESPTGSNQGSSQNRLIRQFETVGITLDRTIHTDADLALTIVEEMFRRGWRTNREHSGIQDHIVLIAEWDTSYARVLPLTLAAALSFKEPDIFKQDLDKQLFTWVKDLKQNKSIEWPEWIHRFSYLRGVDGEISKGKETDSQKAKTDTKDQSKHSNQPFLFGTVERKRPEGPSQFDYLRRLVHRINRIKHDLRADCTFLTHLRDQCPQVRAIGVLGSDVYDKLVVLQALRKQFPSTIFFTTDLDARLTHPDELQWTRNVLTASSFGLSLNPDIQADIPPFRSNYQTAIFYSTLRAMEVQLPSMSGTIGPQDHPRIFEIGNLGAYDLTPLDRHHPIHPARLRLYDKWQGTIFTWGMAIGIIALILALLTRSSFIQKNTLAQQTQTTHYRFRMLFLGLALLLAMASSIFWNEWIMGEGKGEPLTMIDGISIWPAEGLRLIAAVLCLYLLAYCRDRFIKNSSEVSDRFNLAQANIGPAAFRRFSESLKHSLSSLIIPRPQWVFSGYGSAPELWTRYQHLATAPSTVGRCLLPLVLFLVFGFLLTSFLGRPYVPFRGSFSESMDKLVLLKLSVPLVLLLIFWVGDLTMLCRQFILQLWERSLSGQSQCLLPTRPETTAEPEVMITWSTLQLIAQHTAVVGRFLLYPFAVVFLMICSRLEYWDAWDFPLALILIFAFLLLYLLGCAITLRRTANTIRQEAVDRLQQQLMIQLDQGNTQTDQVRYVLQEIKSLRDGAFSPVSQHPILQALLTLGGLASLAVAQYLGMF